VPPPPPSLKILLLLLTPAFTRFFEPVVRQLAERGHSVEVAVHEEREGPGLGLHVTLAQSCPGVSASAAPAPADKWIELGMDLRSALDYLYFLNPRFTSSYRKRAHTRMPQPVRARLDRIGMIPGGNVALRTALRLLERSVPVNEEIGRFIEERNPDVVLLSPYIGLRTIQPEFLRAARSLGVRTGVCVASWDNLSSKSLIRPAPDLVTVWNETQRHEASTIHGIRPSRVAVTGAQCFDHWFEWVARPREEFCARAGLPPDKPYLLYVCFTPFKGGPSELEFVRTWLRRLRSSSDAGLREAAVLVRPHPKRLDQWHGADLTEFGNVVVFPRDRVNPIDDDSRADYHDSIYHSAGVVGLNTSALIEAGIVGKRVHTILVDEYGPSQEQTLHFRYLLEVGGGLLRVARNFDEHVEQLARSIAAGGAAGGANEAFVESFVRPAGLDVAATPIFVEAVERLAGRGRAFRVTPERLFAPLRLPLGPLASRAQAARAAKSRQQAPASAVERRV
jgi:hypothetical protein